MVERHRFLLPISSFGRHRCSVGLDPWIWHPNLVPLVFRLEDFKGEISLRGLGCNIWVFRDLAGNFSVRLSGEILGVFGMFAVCWKEEFCAIFARKV